LGCDFFPTMLNEEMFFNPLSTGLLTPKENYCIMQKTLSTRHAERSGKGTEGANLDRCFVVMGMNLSASKAEGMYRLVLVCFPFLDSP